MKYTKDFIILCTNWISGQEMDKSKFEEYLPIMKENSKIEKVGRSWGFETKDLYILFKTGKIELTKEAIESSFILKENSDFDFQFLESLYKNLYGYLNDFRFITEKTGKCFDIYEPLREALLFKENFEVNDIKQMLNLLVKFGNQKEVLQLEPESEIKFDDIKQILIADYIIEKYQYKGNLNTKQTDNITEFHCYNKPDFISYIINNKEAIEEIFFDEMYSMKDKENKIKTIIKNIENKIYTGVLDENSFTSRLKISDDFTLFD